MEPHRPAARTLKYRILKVLLWAGNRIVGWQLRHGVGLNAFALLETTGRRTGRPRQTPVGNGLVEDTFWLVAAHGTQADFVRNIAREPRVRVLVDRCWRTGIASLMPDDDADQRSRTLPYRWDAALGRAIATTPLTVRIELQPDGPAGCPALRRSATAECTARNRVDGSTG